jgi:hypothetical protein
VTTASNSSTPAAVPDVRDFGKEIDELRERVTALERYLGLYQNNNR